MSKQVIILSVFFVFILVQFVYSQQKTGTIKGIVYDEQTKNPLIGANVVLLSAQTGSATDTEGYFVIDNIVPRIDSLKISYVGFEPRIINSLNFLADSIVYLNVGLKYGIVDIVPPVVIIDKAITDILTASDANRDIQNGIIRIYLGGWLLIDQELKKLSSAYGFEPAITGCFPIDTQKYNQVMIDYLKKRNGDNWYEEFLEKWDELKQNQK